MKIKELIAQLQEIEQLAKESTVAFCVECRNGICEEEIKKPFEDILVALRNQQGKIIVHINLMSYISSAIIV